MGLRELCLSENKKLSTNNLVVLTWGNISIRHEDEIYIKPSGISYDEMKVEDISVISLSSEKCISGAKPSVDLKTHLELYKSFPDIQSVCHTHSKFCTAFAQAHIPLKCLGTTQADYFHGTIPVTSQLSPKQIKEDYERNTGVQIVKALKVRNLSYKEIPGILVQDHGVFSWGLFHTDAFKHAFIMEQLAEMSYYSHTLASDVKSLPDHILSKHYQRKHGKRAYYGQR